MKYYIPNHAKENICLLVEGKSDATQTLLLVHGFGTGKNEGADIFIDVSQQLGADFRIVRFDFTGYGESEGRQADVNFAKQSQDLKTVLNWIKQTYPGSIHILSHSMGCFITSFLSPSSISKTIFSGIPNANTQYLLEQMQTRIAKQGGIVREQGITTYRSSGQVQEIGAEFWTILKQFRPLPAIRDFAEKTKLLIIHPKQDHIVGQDFIREYTTIPHTQFLSVNGDHNYSDPLDRKEFIQHVRSFLA